MDPGRRVGIEIYGHGPIKRRFRKKDKPGDCDRTGANQKKPHGPETVRFSQMDDAGAVDVPPFPAFSLGLFRRSRRRGRSSGSGGSLGGGSRRFGFGSFLLTADEAETKAENDGGKGDANDVHR
jgi:hypothetical protein